MSKKPKYDEDEYIPRSKRISSNDDDDSEQYDDLFDFSDDYEDEDIFAELKYSSAKPPQKTQKSGAVKKTGSASSAQKKNTGTKNSSAVSKTPSHAQNRKKKMKKNSHPVRKFIIAVLCCLFALYLIAIGTVYSVLGKVNYADTAREWDDSVGTDAPNWELADSIRVKNILLLGIDGNSNQGRSDTMIIVSIDRLTRQIKLTSLLRDLYVTIPGHGHNRLNAAYAFGGASLLMQTIECNFRIKIDKYICVNFESFESIISTIGGVNIDLTDAEAAYINKYIPGSLKSGTQRLNGAQAVFYARIRKIGTDFGRTSRQRTLLEALMNECKSMKISELIDLAELISPNLDTNISRLSLSATAIEGISCWFNSIQECSIPVKDGYTSKMIEGMSVLVPDLEKNCTVLHEFIFGKIPATLN